MNTRPFLTRRDLLTMIGKVAGASALYSAMSTMGFAKTSTFIGELNLSQAPTGASILVLGAGLSGMAKA